MTATELQDKIFNYRLQRDGSVSLGELPSLKQLDWLLYSDLELDYMNLTPEIADDELWLLFKYFKNKGGKQNEVL